MRKRKREAKALLKNSNLSPRMKFPVLIMTPWFPCWKPVRFISTCALVNIMAARRTVKLTITAQASVSRRATSRCSSATTEESFRTKRSAGDFSVSDALFYSITHQRAVSSFFRRITICSIVIVAPFSPEMLLGEFWDGITLFGMLRSIVYIEVRPYCAANSEIMTSVCSSSFFTVRLPTTQN